MTSQARTTSMEAEAFAEMSAVPPAGMEAAPGAQAAAPSTYPGLDAGSYPGQHAMDTYRGLGFAVTGLYLSHAPARSVRNRVDTQWIAAASSLANAGWGLVPIYIGAEPAGSSSVPPPDDPLNNATVDGAEAIALAQRAGLQPGRRIFLDVEKAFPANSPYESYVLKWLEVVHAAGYSTALYCFPAQTSWCAAHGIPIWTVHLNQHTGKKNSQTGVITWSHLTSPLPPDAIDPGAIGTQCRFYCQAGNLNVELDYDRWTVSDPSRP